MLPIKLDLYLNNEHPEAKEQLYKLIKIFCIRVDGYNSEYPKKNEISMTNNIYSWMGIAWTNEEDSKKVMICLYEDYILEKIGNEIYGIIGEPTVLQKY